MSDISAAVMDFQPAKSDDSDDRFLPIVAEPVGDHRDRPKAEPKLTRVAFRVSRLSEFCSRRELVNQTGHSIEEWPLVVLKELMDNSLDACEEGRNCAGRFDRG